MTPPTRPNSPSLQQEFGGLYFFARDITASTLNDECSAEAAVRVAGKLERLAEKEIARLHERLESMGVAAHAMKPACSKGCWFCCTHVVMATPPEILLLADHIMSTWSDEQISGLRERIVRHKVAMQSFRNGETETPPRFACPLLKDGECTVWASRPLVCRGWNSVNVDDCRQKMERPESEVHERGFAPQVAVTDFIRQGLSESLQGKNLQGDLCELAMGLEIALGDEEAASRYAAGEDVFAAARAGLQKWT